MSTNQARPSDRKTPEQQPRVDYEVLRLGTERVGALEAALRRTLLVTNFAPEPPVNEKPVTQEQVEVAVPYIAQTLVNEGPVTQTLATSDADDARRDIGALHAAIEGAHETTT